MSLNWLWKDKMGTAMVDAHTSNGLEVVESNLYDGNCLFVELFEWEDEGERKYSLSNFASDEEHFKRCIADNLLAHYHAFNLNLAYKKAKKIAKILLEEQSKGRWDGTLTTYYKEVE